MRHIASLLLVGVSLLFQSGDNRSLPRAKEIPGVDLQGCTSNIAYRYYDVTGDSIPEVRSQLLEKGPRDERGAQRFAYAAWSIEWSWPESKRFDHTKVICKAEVMLPRFTPSEKMNQEEVAEVRDALVSMRNHELRHVEHAIDATKKVHESIVAGAIQGTIKLEKHANQIAMREIERARKFDLRYDAMTHYGRSEGIWLK